MEEKYTISPNNLIINQIPPKSQKKSDLWLYLTFTGFFGYLTYFKIQNHGSIYNLVGSLMLLIVLLITMIGLFIKTLIKKPDEIMDNWTQFELNGEGVTFSVENMAEKRFYAMNQLSKIYSYIYEKKSGSAPKLFQLTLVLKDMEGKSIQEIIVSVNLDKYPLVQEEKKIEALIKDIGFKPNHSVIESYSGFCLLFVLGVAYLIVSIVLMFL